MNLKPSFKIVSIFFSILCLGAPFIGGATVAAEPPPPNIILIIGDDQGWPDYGFMENDRLLTSGEKIKDVVQTPNLDTLAEEGVVFENGFSTASVCLPSLRTALTSAGLHDWQWFQKWGALQKWKVLPPQGIVGDPETSHAVWRRYEVEHFRTLPKDLGRAGYLSWEGGKYWESTYVRGGFTHGLALTDGQFLVNDGMYFGRGPGPDQPPYDEWDYVKWPGSTPGTAYCGDDTLETACPALTPLRAFLEEAKANEKPFFVWFAPMLPHTPYNAPNTFRALYTGRGLKPYEINHLANVSWLDSLIGELLLELDDLQLRENTLLIYFSDNGWGLGFQFWYGTGKGKGTLYELGLRTPMIFNRPYPPEAPQVPVGRVYTDLVSAADIAPTIFDYVGIDPLPEQQGLSLRERIEGSEDGPALERTEFIGMHKDVSEQGDGYFLRTRDWRYLRFASDGHEELYNIIDDPFETTNLAANEENDWRLAAYRTMVDAWLAAFLAPPDRVEIAGRVLDPDAGNRLIGTPLVGSQLKLESVEDGSFPLVSLVGPHGWFRFGPVEPGSYEITSPDPELGITNLHWYQYGGSSPIPVEVPLATTGSFLNLTGEQDGAVAGPIGAQIRGTLTDSNGRPLPNAQIEFRDKLGGDALHSRVSTQPDGSYRAENLACTTYTVTATAPGYQDVEVEVVVDDASPVLTEHLVADPIPEEDHVDIRVVLQGSSRPVPVGWEIPLSVALFATGSDVMNDSPIHEFSGTATWSAGHAAYQIPYLPGTYDITVDSEHTLMNVVRNVVISPGNREVVMGTLLEGDCDDNHGIGASDFIVLSAAYGACDGAGYDPRADLDRDGCIGDDDYALMVANWGKTSPIELSYEADVDLSVVLQGSQRPDPAGWEIPLSVAFFEPGADVIDDDPQYLFEATTTKSGGYAVAQVTGVQPGTYDITVDSEHTLMNVKRGVVISAPSTSLKMGTLLEGDCDDDHEIDGTDFIIVWAAYGACQEPEDPEYDPRADLDRDGCVGNFDYALLLTNFLMGNCGEGSPIEVPYEADVDLSVVLQGSQRPDPAGWEIPLSVAFFEPGADVIDDDPQYLFEATTTKSGGYAVAQVTGVRPGTYDITVDSEHTLMNVKRGVAVSAPSTSLMMGTLLEGDCDDDHEIDGGDFMIVEAAYGACQEPGDPAYDPRADLDRNGCVDDADPALLMANWTQASPIEVAGAEILVGLQGSARPDPAGWEVPATVAFFEPGADVMNDDPQYRFELTTTKSGGYAAARVTGVQPGTYDITVDSEHTLMNVKRGLVISAPSTEVVMGALLEGDCDDNHGIGASDHIILSAAYGRCQGVAGYDSRADLDRDGCVGSDDYPLLEANWGKTSPIEVP